MRAAALLLVLLAQPGQTTTLQHLSLEDLAARATAVVRGFAGGSHAEQEGALAFTTSAFEVVERWKGNPEPALTVSLPGGARSPFAGVPTLVPGREYVLFLWTGPSGRTQVVGLSQGVFEVRREPGAEPLLAQAPLGGARLAGAAEDAGAVSEIPLESLDELFGSSAGVAGRRAGP